MAGLRMRSGRADDSALARRAAAGDRDAFAELYRRHESRVFNLCYRILGSRDDAAGATPEAFVGVVRRLPRIGGPDLAFGTCVLSSARDACHDLIQGRRRAQPSYEMSAISAGGGVAFDPGDPEDDPERRALLQARNEEIRTANLSLPLRQREVLALRELEDLSYDEIAELMEVDRNSVAQLIARARLNLRDALRGTALASIAATSPDCEGALALIALEQDGQLEGNSNAAGWLEEHLMHCHTCLVERDAMLEAAVSYRAWAPVAAGPLLFRETMARAAEQVAADRSATMAQDGPRRAVTGAAAAGAVRGGAAAGAGGEAEGAGGRAAAILRHRRRNLTLIGVLTCLLVLVALALAASEDDPVETAVPAAQEKHVAVEPEARRAADSADKPTKKKRRRRKPETPVPAASPEPVAPAPVPVAVAEPTEKEARPEPRRPRHRVNVERRPGGVKQRAPAPEITPAPPPQPPADTAPIPPPPQQPPPEPPPPPDEPPAPPCTGATCPPGQPPPGL